MAVLGIWLKRMTGALVILLAGPALAAVTGAVDVARDWRTASREPLGIAPDPATTPEPVLQVYGARTFGWRAAFAVHSWIAVKPRRGRALHHL